MVLYSCIVVGMGVKKRAQEFDKLVVCIFGFIGLSMIDDPKPRCA